MKLSNLLYVGLIAGAAVGTVKLVYMVYDDILYSYREVVKHQLRDSYSNGYSAGEESKHNKKD